MEKLLNLILFLVPFISYSQSPIINLTDDDGSDEVADSYYKDIDNHLNQFEGTWLYTNASISFKIVLIKKIMAFNGKFYEDTLIGEYQYIENGVEKINTLPIESAPNPREHNVCGNSLLNNTDRPVCGGCPFGQKRVSLFFYDPIRDRAGDLIIKKMMVGAQQAIHIRLQGQGKTYKTGTPPEYNTTTVPPGEYTLIKQ